MKVEFYPERLCDKHKRVTPGSANCADPPCRDRHYTIDGERTVNGLSIESVTTILKETGDRFGQAAWWGMVTGTAGVLEVLRRNGVHAMNIREGTVDTDGVVDILKRCRLTVLHTRDDAAQRGTDVHADGERWALTGELPPPDNGWRQALIAFVETERPEPMGAEILVGSKQYAYAGTFDLLARLPKLDAVGVFDLKSKSRPPRGRPNAYPQHHLQLRGYEDARREMGHDPSDFQCVVNLYPDGTYALIQGRATSQQWQSSMRLYRDFMALRGSIEGQPVGVAA